MVRASEASRTILQVGLFGDAWEPYFKLDIWRCLEHFWGGAGLRDECGRLGCTQTQEEISLLQLLNDGLN